LYIFECNWRGKCFLEAKTSGKNGFTSPKLFVLRSFGDAWSGTLTLTYKDKSAATLHSNARKNDPQFLRIAIGQFIRWTEVDNGDFKGDLDLTCAPFLGDITNRHGRLIALNSFYPKAAACEN